MSNRIRAAISERIGQILRRNNVYYELEASSKSTNILEPIVQWSLPTDKHDDIAEHLQELRPDNAGVLEVRLAPSSKAKGPRKLEFQLAPETYLESLLLPNHAEDCNESSVADTKEHTVVEFSSPNIAKPFHVGHLRSTIIGNVVANLHQRVGHKVTKLNYLGDWGTQFGMLQVGVDMIGATDEHIQRDPITTLYRAYVAANTAAKTDASISEKARQIFNQLESSSDPEMSRQWRRYRQYTIAELERVYLRLGVRFDRYEWESQYSQHQISAILERLTEKSLLLDEHDGRKVVEVDERRIPVIKSDGTTLYLTRDIAALVDRFHRFQFTRILYVVENGQSDHFNACFKTTAALCEDIPLNRLTHVKFGRIHGMSTRSGNAVFLKDVLDEARDVMLEKQLQSSTTKIDLSERNENYKNVADILGVSAVIINDLKQRRQRDYNFDWNKALQVNGDCGIKLQYTHCRLFSLLENMADEISIDNCKPSLEHLKEPEAQSLLRELSRYEQTIWLAKEQLEACVLVNYLFGLCNATSRALKRLNVKNESCVEKQKNRLLLFRAAKMTLKDGMEILGLKPLNKM